MTNETIDERANQTVLIELPLWVAIIVQEVLLEEYKALVDLRDDDGGLGVEDEPSKPGLREDALDRATDIIPLALPDIEERSEIILRLSVQRGEIV